jgi:hypothetical protein
MGVGNALNLIPETYKVNGKQFHMTDGNEKYEIRWEGSLTEGRAIVLKASDKNLMNEDMENMKRLMGYKSQDTLGTVKGAARLDENKKFTDIWGKTKNIMTEMTSGYGFTGEGNFGGVHEDELTPDQKSIEKRNNNRVKGDIISKFGDSIITILGKYPNISEFRINPDSSKLDLDDSNSKAISIGFSNIINNADRFEIKIGLHSSGAGYTMANGNLRGGMIPERSFYNLIDITYAAIEATGKNDSDKQAMKTSVTNELKGKINSYNATDEYIDNKYGLSEQLNPDESYYTAYKTDGDIGLDNFGSYFEIISSEEVDEYQDNGWSIEGPMSEDEAMLKQDQHDDDQRQFKYLNTLDDRDVERDEMNYNRGGKTPSHISAMNKYDAVKRDRAQQISKRKLRGGDDW